MMIDQPILDRDAALRLRSPDIVMRLSRMGSAHQTRLSFMRSLLRRLKGENWTFERAEWEIDGTGQGHAVYKAVGPRRTYSLVAFAHDLPDEMRSDRVIATAWDATFTLFDGVPGPKDIDRLAQNVPFQEAGRISDSELSLSRANRSVRLWNHVVTSLAEGRQPSIGEIDKVGYLMRTTAVYGSGKFGAADRAALLGRQVMSAPFHIEMLSVWFIRAFTLDLAEHMARAQGGNAAVAIEPELRRRFGVGNSTGLGMAPFLVNHPALLNAWMTARETAIGRVYALPQAALRERETFRTYLRRARLNADGWHSDHPRQREKCARLREDLATLERHVENGALEMAMPWQRLLDWTEDHLDAEAQEQTAALVLEPYGALVDDLTSTMQVDENACFRIDGSMSVERLKQLIVENYGWATGIDYAAPKNRARFWYVSEEKQEPRLGEREREDGAEYEQPLDVGRAVAELFERLGDYAGQPQTVAGFLRVHHGHRHMVRRVQMAADRPFAEIRDNLIGADMMPIDILRCKLAFFGATRFDPRSDRWVRICMFQNAPFPHELAGSQADDWAFPPLREAQS